MAEVPCDICRSQEHDYRHCQAGALLESQTPGTSQPGQNEDQGNVRVGPCGWCEKKGHISLECPAKFYSPSMKERFPKIEKRRKSKILEYTCRRCGERHPFNQYCPYATKPPIVPGECRSCATLMNHHDEECELVAIKDRIGLCTFCGDISHLYADCPDRYPNRGPKRVLPRKEGPGRKVSPWTGRDPPKPPPYSGVCSFCRSAGHGHELCPKLKEAVREQADQIARIQMARYKEVRNRAQEPNSRTKKLVSYVQDKARVAKEDWQDSRRLPVYSTGGGGSGLDGNGDRDPTDQDRIAVQNRGVMDSLSEGDGVEEDRPKTQTRRMMMGYLGVSGGDKGPGVIQDPRDQRDQGDPRDQWDPGEYPGDYLPLVWGTRSYHPKT